MTGAVARCASATTVLLEISAGSVTLGGSGGLAGCGGALWYRKHAECNVVFMDFHYTLTFIEFQKVFRRKIICKLKFIDCICGYWLCIGWLNRRRRIRRDMHLL